MDTLTNTSGTFTIKIVTCNPNGGSGHPNGRKSWRPVTLFSTPAMASECESLKRQWIEENLPLAQHAELSYSFAAILEV